MTSILVPEKPLPDTLVGKTQVLSLRAPCVVGILNITPDSFSDGGRYLDVGVAVARALRMVEEGAGMIDIGGESTRPGARAVSVQEEVDRVLPVIEGVVRAVRVPVAIDTTKSAVACCAIDAGAEFVNDISGLDFDPEMARVVAAAGAGLVIMHTRGHPETMQQDTRYADVVSEVKAALGRSLDKALAAGISAERIAVDPGIGFGKDLQGNLELLRRLAVLSELGRPIYLGTSRKSFIGRVLDQEDPGQRLEGTLATVALGVAAGARLFRVHDVAAACRAARMAWAVCEGATWAP